MRNSSRFSLPPPSEDLVTTVFHCFSMCMLPQGFLLFSYCMSHIFDLIGSEGNIVKSQEHKPPIGGPRKLASSPQKKTYFVQRLCFRSRHDALQAQQHKLNGFYSNIFSFSFFPGAGARPVLGNDPGQCRSREARRHGRRNRRRYQGGQRTRREGCRKRDVQNIGFVLVLYKRGGW